MDRGKLQENIRKCARCGKCRTVCPLFPLDLSESATARGKIEVIHRRETGDLRFPGKELLSFLDNCLLCGRCEMVCPNAVETVGIFAHARSEVVSVERMPLAKKAFLKAVSLPVGVVSAASSVGNVLLKSFSEKIPGESGVFYRLPSFLSREGRAVPEFPPASYLERFGVDAAAGDNDRPLLFTGCVFNYLYPSVLEDSLRGAPSVISLRDQACCGLPAYASGDVRVARQLAEKNLETFLPTRGDLVVPCASCLYMLREVYPRMFEGSELEEGAHRLADRCVTLEEFLFDEMGMLGSEDPLLYEEEAKIGFHVPCHLRPYPGVVDDIIRALRGRYGGRFVEMEGDDMCCGFGGTFNITNYRKSKEMGAIKIELAERSGVGIILSSCSGCIHHLRESAAHSRSKVEVAHAGKFLVAEKRKVDGEF